MSCFCHKPSLAPALARGSHGLWSIRERRSGGEAEGRSGDNTRAHSEDRLRVRVGGRAQETIKQEKYASKEGRKEGRVPPNRIDAFHWIDISLSFADPEMQMD